MIRRHSGFLISLSIGLLVALASLAMPAPAEFRALLAANAGFVSYLVIMLRRTSSATAADLRAHSDKADEGLPLILTLALVAVGVSLSAIVLALNSPEKNIFALRLMALAAVPLGWAMLQILIGFHYAHVYYRPEAGEARGGLQFPGTKSPGPWDFLYFSFGIAMTAQVSDVVITSTSLRKMVSLHAVFSYFYNAVILALAVNAALTGAG